MKLPTFVCDTREQLAYGFGPDQPVVRKKLDAGDYSVLGYERGLAVERKSLNDLVGTVIFDRKRFASELIKLSSYPRACVVVEASLRDITDKKYSSGAHPNSVMGAVVSICASWNIPVFFCGDRPHAVLFVREWLIRGWKLLSDKKRWPGSWGEAAEPVGELPGAESAAEPQPAEMDGFAISSDAPTNNQTEAQS